MSGPGAKRYSVKSNQPSSKKKRTSYSHITAADVVQSILKEELIRKFRSMLTDHRTVLLEARDLIDSDCRDSIQAKLRSGQRAGAATELVEYFKDNHDGDKMMEFCTFVEDQAGNSSPLLVQLANTIRECVETLSEPLPSNPPNVDLPVGTPAAVSRDSTIIQYSTGTPLAGPSDNSDEPPLPPLVEHLLDKALLDRLYPLRECKDSTPEDSEVEDSGPDGAYRMSTYPRGSAIVINNEKFKAESGLKDRPGTEKDGKALQHLFTSSGFVTTIFNDLTAGRMQQVLQSYGQRNHTKAQCLIVAILTHGGKGGSLYGVDGGLVKVKTLTEFFTGRKCRSLVGKPKLFFIQACRGKKHDSAVRGYEETDSFQQTNETSDGLKDVILPSQSDFLLSFSTVEGYVSWRDAEYGTWYVRDLVEVFTKKAGKEHLLDMLTMVNDKVSKRSASEDGSKQTSSVKTELRKKLYFKPGEYDLNHLDREPNWCCIA